MMRRKWMQKREKERQYEFVKRKRERVRERGDERKRERTKKVRRVVKENEKSDFNQVERSQNTANERNASIIRFAQSTEMI